jgi:aryl-alcohol dehydrogenase-like predicted oxidoreductase
MERSADMPRRALGSTGESVSLVGLGGFHLAERIDERLALRLVRTALDRGVTFLDNCWDYNDGASEERMGRALRDGYRDRTFLMTKIDGRTKKEAARQLDESLRRLQTDRIDLVQHHEVIRFEDPHLIFAEGGANEALLEAREAGKLRFIGFTGHKDPHIHLHMLDVAGRHGFHFDAVQLPLNVFDAHYRSFEHLVLPRLVDEGIGVLAMKPLAAGLAPGSGVVTGVECLQYAMQLPVSVVITGIDSLEFLEQALEAAATYRRLSRADIEALLARTAAVAATGELERFKTAADHDGTAANPEWLGIPAG